MGLDRSPDGTTPEDQAILNCLLCQTLIKSVAENYQTSCGHDFHRKCIATHFKNSNKCPICDAVCLSESSGIVTRRRSKVRRQAENPTEVIGNNRAFTSTEAARSNTAASERGDPSESMNAIALLTMERRLLTNLTEKMTELIQKTVGKTVSRLMATPIHSATNSVNIHAPDINPPVTYLENQNQNT